MATTDGMEAESDSRVRQVIATLSPESRFPVPISDGYSVYSALLAVLSSVDETVGQRIHDSPLGSLHCSGLQGRFGQSDRSHHKTVLPNETYVLSLGIIHPDDSDVFQGLVNALVLENETLSLSNGDLRVERFESENATHNELLERAGACDDPAVRLNFRTATCIEEVDEVTTAFPYRWTVFNSLAGKWNRSCPSELDLELDRDAVLGSIIEKPAVDTLDTHSVLVNRVENDDGKTRNIFKQGFTGECIYEFKEASKSLQNAVTALAMFGEYSGVGSAVARGCGTIETEVRS